MARNFWCGPNSPKKNSFTCYKNGFDAMLIFNSKTHFTVVPTINVNKAAFYWHWIKAPSRMFSNSHCQKRVCPILHWGRNSAPSLLCRIHKNVLKSQQKNPSKLKLNFLSRIREHLSVIVARNPADIVNRKY